jgi:prepilin-type processing-associated H-X9-DG protein
MNCGPSGLNDSIISEPSSIVLLVDEDKTLNDGYFWTQNGAPPGGAADKLTQSHLDGGNLLYVDGHVKFQPFAKDPAMFQSGPTDRGRTTGSPRFLDADFPNGGKGGCA